MDCYFHNAVPSVAVCHDCRHSICATCRDDEGLCPGCRLERRMQAAARTPKRLHGRIGPSSPPPPSSLPPYPPTTRQAPLSTVSPETRLLLAVGYVMWPLAALALLDPTRSRAVRRQAIQALSLNLGLFGLGIALEAVAHIPLLGWPAIPLLALMFPVWLVATVLYGIRVWDGDAVRIPIVSEWLDQREERRHGDHVAA